MRLTLRTLLAWRDRTLPAAQSQHLEAKVAGSSAAHMLSGRIDRVIADHGLAAPRFAAAADPNAAAEYLDNVLSTAALDGFERSCLQSDELLAEVAACHRILAEVSLDPAVLPPLGPADHKALLEAVRVHALATAGTTPPESERPIPPNATTLPVPLDTTPPTDTSGIGSFGTAGAVLPANGSSHDAAPSHATTPAPSRSSLAAWLLAVSAMLLLGVLAGVLAWSVGGGRSVARRPDRTARQPAVAADTPAIAPAEQPAAQRPDDPDGERIDAPARAAPAAEPAGVGASIAPAGDLPTPDTPAETAPPAPATTPPIAAPQATAPPVAEPRPTPPANAQPPANTPGSGEMATVPFGDALAIAAAVPPKPADAAPMAKVAEAEAEPDEPGPAAVVTVAGEDAMFVGAVDADGPQAWDVARGGDTPAIPVSLVAPPFLRPAAHVDGVRLVFAPSTRVRVRHDEEGVPWVSVDFGALFIVGTDAPARVRISAGGLDGVATTVPGAPLGVEVTHQLPPGPDALAGEPAVTGSLHATSAAIPWIQRVPEPDATTGGVIPAGCTATWSASQPGVEVARRQSTPTWLASAVAAGNVCERAARGALNAALPSGEPAEPALRRLAAGRRSEQRIAAAAALSLLGDQAPLATLLVEQSPQRMLRNEEWRCAERAAMPVAYAMGPRSYREMSRAIEAAAPPGAGELLVALAEQAAGVDETRVQRAQLVDALESPWLVVRRYAWQNLTAIDPPSGLDRLRYRPDRSADLNAAGVRWWRDRVAQERPPRGTP